jgi:hypothetical protein
MSAPDCSICSASASSFGELMLINSNYCRRARVQQHIDGVVGEVKTPKRIVWSRSAARRSATSSRTRCSTTPLGPVDSRGSPSRSSLDHDAPAHGYPAGSPELEPRMVWAGDPACSSTGGFASAAGCDAAAPLDRLVRRVFPYVHAGGEGSGSSEVK